MPEGGKLSYGQVLTRLAAADPDRPAVYAEDEGLTRAELERRANRLARTFAARGVKAGDRVTLALPGSLAFFEACMAAWKLGAVPNPVSPSLPANERRALEERARPALVVEPGFAADPHRSDGPLPDAVPPHERAMASGGSTGLPKLIVAANPGLYDPEAPSRLFAAENAMLVPGPLYHAAPFSAAWQALFGGATAVVMRRFEAARCLALVARHRADRMLVVPTMMLRIWRLPAAERAAHDVSSLRFVMTGGAPCPPWLMRAWIDWLGADVMHEAYGPSERIGGTFITGREWLAHPGSVGRPSVGSRIRILDPETGAERPAGQLGEIYFMPAGGPGSTYRYVGAEARATSDGWESVGDMGWLDEDGYLYLGDRRSDMILVGGRNVYPAEVEAALDAHPDVRSSAVIGLPEEDGGQRVHALVEIAPERRGEPALEAEFEAHLAAHLVGYKRPRSLEWVDHPLRDDAGKLRRSALRAARIGSPD